MQINNYYKNIKFYRWKKILDPPENFFKDEGIAQEQNLDATMDANADDAHTMNLE